MQSTLNFLEISCQHLQSQTMWPESAAARSCNASAVVVQARAIPLQPDAWLRMLGNTVPPSSLPTFAEEPGATHQDHLPIPSPWQEAQIPAAPAQTNMPQQQGEESSIPAVSHSSGLFPRQAAVAGLEQGGGSSSALGPDWSPGAPRPIVLDVRNSYEWDAGHFEGAARPQEVTKKIVKVIPSS